MKNIVTILKKYKIGIDVGAILLFVAIMLPNFIWFVFPAPNDILRAESMTPILDIIASVCQVLFLILFVFVQYSDIVKNHFPLGIVCALAWYLVYLVAWLFYYEGSVSAVVVVLLCIAPCLSFANYALERKNIPAMIPLTVFSVCHLLYGIFNFIY